MREVIHYFTHSTYSHVAITENGTFMGLLGEADLDTFQETSPIEEFRYQLDVFSVPPGASWLDILEVFSRNEANLLPVVDDDNRVLGYYDLNDVVDLFTDMPFFTEPGTMLVVSKPLRDYSFSELAQIVEGNSTLKIGDSNINDVLQTFRRYHYQVVSGSIDDKFLEELRQRSDYLDKYLNV